MSAPDGNEHSDPPQNADEFRRLNEQIEQHPGRVAYERWQSLRRIHGVLLANEAELRTLIDQVENDPRLAIEIVRNIGQTGFKERFWDELIRRAHNYLSAVKMLVDHTRNLMRPYAGQPVADEYARRVAEMIATGRAPFVQKLRDYLIHYSIPPLGIVVQLVSGPGRSSTIYLDRDAALPYEDWPARGREYLRAQERQISLRDLIAAYAADLEQLYRWLFDRFEELHANDIAELNDLIVRLQGAQNTPGHPDHQLPERPPPPDDGASRAS